MCVNSHWIFNKYIKRNVLVKCGKCPACLQEKACARSNRIRNNVTPGSIALFVTLTYSNDYLPYVRRFELYDATELNVYRNCSGRFVYDRFSDKVTFRKRIGVHKVSSVGLDIPLMKDSIKDYLPANGLGKDVIGVLLFQDLQKFYKRLRQILIRNYNYYGQFSVFNCSELGSFTHRPHFHSLIFIGKDDEAVFRSAICEAWPFADRNRTAKYIEIARDAASYVSSYCSGSSRLQALFQNDAFAPRHSYSKNFGVALDCFSLPSILDKIDQRSLYYYSKVRFDGSTDVAALPIPGYVVSRYFPRFKGSSRLSRLQLCNILLDPSSVGYVLRDSEVKFKHYEYTVSFNSAPIVDSPLYHYSNMETYRIFVRLENCYQYFHSVTGLGRFDYAYYYLSVWDLVVSQRLKDSHKDIENVNDYFDFYDNASQLCPDHPCHLKSRWLRKQIAPTLLGVPLESNPNKRGFVLRRHSRLTELYNKLDKQKRVTNYCLSQAGHNF